MKEMNTEKAFDALQKANKMRRAKKTANESKKEKKLKSWREYYERNREVLLAKQRERYHRRKANGTLKKLEGEALEKRRAYLREYSRQLRQFKKANGIPLMSDANKERFYKKRKERYNNDPEYRKKVLGWAKKSQKKMREKRKKKFVRISIKI